MTYLIPASMLSPGEVECQARAVLARVRHRLLVEQAVAEHERGAKYEDALDADGLRARYGG